MSTTSLSAAPVPRLAPLLRQWLLVVLCGLLGPLAFAQPPCDDDDDDDNISGSIQAGAAVCEGENISLTFFFTDDDDDDDVVVDVTYTIGGASFSLNGITSGYVVFHPATANTTATLLSIYSIADGCIVSTNFSIPIPVWPQPLVSIGSTTNPSCGQNNGSVSLSATGGTPAFQYRISGGNLQSSPSFSGLGAGTYTFEVLDANGCSATTAPISLNDQNAPTLTVTSSTNPSCGQNNGSVSLSATGGTPPFQYRITGGNLQNSPSFDGLEAGTYTFEVIDANGCSATTAPISLNEEAAPILSINSTTDPSCGQSNGSISLSATGGTPPFQYRILGGNLQNSPSFDGLEAGTYTFEVLDANGCSATTAPISLNDENAPTLTVTSSTNPSCGQNNGSVSLSATGGTPAFQYRILGGNLQSSPSFGGLAAGPYTFEVIDANGCSTTTDFLLSDQSNLVLTVEIIQQPSCAGDGRVQAGVTGGQGPYTFSLDGINWQSSPVFSDLGSGTYALEVRDAASCLALIPFELIQDNGGLPSAEIDGEIKLDLCLGEWYELVGSVAAGVTVRWYSPSSLVSISDPNANITEVQVGAAGDYWLYYELSSPLCPAYSLDSIFLSIPPRPLAQPDGPLQISAGDAITINVLTNDQAANTVLTLLSLPQHGTLTQSSPGVFRFQSESLSESVRDTFFYQLCHLVCTTQCDTGMVILSIGAGDGPEPEPDPCDLSNVPDNVLPEGLTLNGDDYNDRLEFVIIDLSTCPFNNLGSELIIFNRWGDKVFEQSPYENQWDGRSRDGQLLPPGVYYYVLKVNVPDQEPFIRFKNVTIFY